ncbi:hypothetical protein AB3331_03155 [Streptococcus sp. H49]|uniref:hypothetical protein n=1 Tax=Streptococcus huangxiaojuni TaxID=3237239 RepID=UPI0034A30BF8
MKPYLLKKSTGYKIIKQKNIDFKQMFANYEINKSDFNKRILIFTRKEDDEITLLGPHLLASGIDYVRVDQEDFLDNFSINISICNDTEDKISFIYKSLHYSSDDIDIIWFRHFNLNTLVSKKLNKIETIFLREQWNRIITYISGRKEFKVINKPLVFEELTKPKQLDLAKLCDFNIIPTTITNISSKITELNKEYSDLFIKSVDHHFLEIKQNKYLELYGGKINGTVNKYEVKYSPAIFQPMLKGLFEARVTVVGGSLFACKQVTPIFDDWHKEDISSLKLVPIELPKKISDSIKHFSEYVNLEIYSIDFFVNNNKWFFVEANVQGDWNWVEERTRQPITEQISKFFSEIQ